MDKEAGMENGGMEGMEECGIEAGPACRQTSGKARAEAGDVDSPAASRDKDPAAPVQRREHRAAARGKWYPAPGQAHEGSVTVARRQQVTAAR